jgi:putative transposase
MFWLTQQFRNATPYGNQTKYLIHDNDPVFKSKVFQGFFKEF